MKTNGKAPKRDLVFPAATALLLLSAAAAVNAVKSDDLVATDGKIEVIDGRHVQIITRQMPFEPGSTLKLTNANGRITVSSWDREEILVTAEKRLQIRVSGLGWVMNKLKIPYKTTDEVEEYFEQVDVALKVVDNGLEIETIVPKWKPGVNVSIHYNIQLPKKANLDIKTSNGHISVADIDGTVTARSSNGRLVCEDVSGSITARTTNGSIVCENISGAVQANTSNGSVTVRHPAVLVDGDSIVCGTSNGSIRIHLPTESSFDVTAKTTSGRIKSDFEVDKTGQRNTKRLLAGRVGSGGPRVELKTSNGSITLTQI